MATAISIQTTVNAGRSKAWTCMTRPEHITQWNFASPEWWCPSASMELVVGGKFSWRMEAKDGSMGFDFGGTITAFEDGNSLEYELEDGRKVQIEFKEVNGQTTIMETFEPEDQNPIEMQRAGWQAILDNFKKHCESFE